SSGLRRFFRYAMFIYSFYLCYSLSLYPFTKRYAQPYFFSCLIRQTFKTLCLLNYALMIRHDYDITSSLRRWALQKQLRNLVLLVVELTLIIIVQIPIAINQVFMWRRNQSSTSDTLPSNTIPNLKGEMKAITTWSGVAYEGPSIPTPIKVVEQVTGETMDKEQTNFQGTMLLKKLLEKLGDPGKFLIPCDFREWIEEYAQEIPGFSNNSSSGNPTSTFEPILFESSLSLTPFEGSNFILEEIDAYLKDESISPEIDHADCDPEGDICFIEKLLNDDPFLLPPIDLKQ
nr:reverse transcriptase domain-containing protein [Tanacetum cinerariifolium]